MYVGNGHFFFIIQMLSILDGHLFPMKALGYYAVVTGKGILVWKTFFFYMHTSIHLYIVLSMLHTCTCTCVMQFVVLHLYAGNTGSDIDEIQIYEREYFAKSKLFQCAVFITHTHTCMYM